MWSVSAYLTTMSTIINLLGNYEPLSFDFSIGEKETRKRTLKFDICRPRIHCHALEEPDRVARALLRRHDAVKRRFYETLRHFFQYFPVIMNVPLMGGAGNHSPAGFCNSRPGSSDACNSWREICCSENDEVGALPYSHTSRNSNPCAERSPLWMAGRWGSVGACSVAGASPRFLRTSARTRRKRGPAPPRRTS